MELTAFFSLGNENFSNNLFICKLKTSNNFFNLFDRRLFRKWFINYLYNAGLHGRKIFKIKQNWFFNITFHTINTTTSNIHTFNYINTIIWFGTRLESTYFTESQQLL
jgi:hypothetical protein